ncbi:ATP-dependent Clp protease adapter ClpS [Microbacterium hominis]|uniref:ATP-dependent Clp protease adapter protein ClpS n=1 Tax=Microbacterium hominis TaxID=162426 RepID=A0A7D4QIC0_9MICO|nr:ATP-dependent Clp protease adapter ClpS [Microbacterium hominis]QKJ19316.1 ATP-dependent Clp protease adapter ClpS [Microbacterium hominis]
MGVIEATRTEESPVEVAAPVPDRPWQTVVWDDPVNLMSYVTHVFREYFGLPAERAERLMLAVHNDGHAVVAEGAREQMELHTQAMHDYGLWATVRKAPE